MRKFKQIWGKGVFLMVVSLSVVLLSAFDKPGMASQSQTVHHYKLLSTLEYSGKSQFRSEFETVCTVKKLALADDKVQYFLSMNGTDVAEDGHKSGEQFSLEGLSFVIDDKTQHLSAANKDLAFLEKISNGCIGPLRKVTRANLGKTWKQHFDFLSLGNRLPSKLRFTLTAIPLKTEAFGELIAVRALSEPFFVKIAKENSAIESIQCSVNCVYVFDPELEDIYLSIFVFKTAANVDGFKEVLQHTVATCKADDTGRQIDISDLGKDRDFGRLVGKIGVTNSLKVVKDAPLPQWARDDGVRSAQVANICAAASCEGALNPVATIFVPVARIVELQSSREPITTAAPLAASGSKESGWFDWFGWNLPTAAWGTGLGFGVAGVSGAFNKTEYRSPSTP